MDSHDGEYFVGVITEIVDPDLYTIKIDIPGVTKDALALPMRGEIDEPMPGNTVLVKSLDPIYQSLYIYSKLKENKFIGFRSRGKMVNITPDYVTVGIFDPDTEYTDDTVPEVTSWIKIDSKGNIEVKSEGEAKINIDGTCNIVVKGNTTIDSPKVQIKGGKLLVNGKCTPNGANGGFCGIPICPFIGMPQIGDTIKGT